MREHFYNELKVALLENYQYSSKNNKQLQEKDIHDMTNNIEYEIFSSTKVPNKYKLDMSKLVRYVIFTIYIYIYHKIFIYTIFFSIQISSIRKCTNDNTIYEKIRDYSKIECHDIEFNNSNNIDTFKEQESNITKTEFNENTCLSNECSKPIFPSVFKTALEVLNEEKLQTFTSDKNEKISLKKLCVKNVKIKQIKNETSIINFNSAQKNTCKSETPLMQMSNDFVCARKIYDDNTSNFSTSSSKSKSNTSSSKPKVRRSKTDKVNKPGKTVYEQILASARSVSKKTTDEKEDIFLDTESKVDSAGYIKSKNEIKNKNKRDYEVIEHHEDDIKSAKKRKIVHNECNDETNNYVSNKTIDKKILDDEFDTEIVKERNAGININTINDDLLMPENNKTRKHLEEDTTNTINDDLSTEKNKTRKHLEEEVNVELKKKEKTAHLFNLKQHEKDKSNNRLKVPADRVMQFKTAEILKSYLMKYYPSERLPDRATFSKTCREMHYSMLRKKIFGKIISKIYI